MRRATTEPSGITVPGAARQARQARVTATGRRPAPIPVFVPKVPRPVPWAGIGLASLGIRVPLAVGFQAGAHAIKDCLVRVGLGVEVPVEEHPGDAGLGGDVIQARRREAAAGECLGGGGEDLLPPLGAGQAA